MGMDKNDVFCITCGHNPKLPSVPMEIMTTKKFGLSMLFLFSALAPLSAQTRTDGLMLSIMGKNKDSLFQRVLEQRDVHKLQIIYTQIDRDADNVPTLTNHYFNVNPANYYNPASTVKLPTAIFTLEKLNRLDIPGVDMHTRVQFEKGEAKESAVFSDSTSRTGFPSMAHYIKKALLISENDPYNRFFQFVGPRTINRRFAEMELKSSRITSQFLGLSVEENRHTNPVSFLDSKGKVLYTQPADYNEDPYVFATDGKVGKKHYNRQGELVDGPMDFTTANEHALEDLQKILQTLMFPISVPEAHRYDLRKADYDLLYRYLSQYPSETDYPKYDTEEYYDSYAKFFFRANSERMPPNIRVFNKAGWTYGFLTDVAYIADFENKVEFMLTATIYANADDILNDGKYDYETVGWPFLSQLGQTFYEYELGRERQYVPDLSRFEMPYQKRKVDDRPVLGNRAN